MNRKAIIVGLLISGLLIPTCLLVWGSMQVYHMPEESALSLSHGILILAAILLGWLGPVIWYLRYILEQRSTIEAEGWLTQLQADTDAESQKKTLQESLSSSNNSGI